MCGHGRWTLFLDQVERYTCFITTISTPLWADHFCTHRGCGPGEVVTQERRHPHQRSWLRSMDDGKLACQRSLVRQDHASDFNSLPNPLGPKVWVYRSMCGGPLQRCSQSFARGYGAVDRFIEVAVSGYSGRRVHTQKIRVGDTNFSPRGSLQS